MLKRSLLTDAILAAPHWTHICFAESDAGDASGGSGGDAGEGETAADEGGAEGGEDGGSAVVEAEGEGGTEEGAVSDDDEEEEIDVEDRKVALPKWLAKAFKEGTQRNVDYTNKTKALADERRAKEAEWKSREEIIALRDTAHVEVQELRGVETRLGSDEFKSLDQELSEWSAVTKAQWDNLRETDPQRYDQARANFDAARERRQTRIELRQRRQELFDGLNNKIGEFRTKQTTLEKTASAAAEAEVAKRIKGWTPDKKAAVHKFALSRGLPESGLSLAFQDPAAIELIHDAMLYRQALAKPVIAKAGTPGEAAPKKPAAKPVAKITGRSAQVDTEPKDTDSPEEWVRKRNLKLTGNQYGQPQRAAARR